MLIGWGVGVLVGVMVGVCVGSGVLVNVGVCAIVLVWLGATGMSVDMFCVCAMREQLISKVEVKKTKNSCRVRFIFMSIILRTIFKWTTLCVSC